MLVKAVHSMALFDEKSNRYGIPSLAVKLKAGQVFGKCLNVAIRRGLETHDNTLVSSCEMMK